MDFCLCLYLDISKSLCENTICPSNKEVSTCPRIIISHDIIANLYINNYFFLILAAYEPCIYILQLSISKQI